LSLAECDLEARNPPTLSSNGGAVRAVGTEALEMATTFRMAHLAQGFGLDLPEGWRRQANYSAFSFWAYFRCRFSFLNSQNLAIPPEHYAITNHFAPVALAVGIPTTLRTELSQRMWGNRSADASID